MKIRCESKGCLCPSAAGDRRKYTFRYIDNVKNYIYYDVPKVGSSTLRRMLFPKSWPLGPCSPCLNSVQAPIHTDKRYISFTFVRNPYDRILSAWKYFTTNSYAAGLLKDHNINVGKNTTFEEFLDISINQHSDHHWQPQSDYVPQGVNFTGRLENFQKDYNALCNLIAFPKAQLLHEKQIKRKHYSEYYSKETKKIVTEVYAEDIDRFGYKF